MFFLFPLGLLGDDAARENGIRSAWGYLLTSVSFPLPRHIAYESGFHDVLLV